MSENGPGPIPAEIFGVDRMPGLEYDDGTYRPLRDEPLPPEEQWLEVVSDDQAPASVLPEDDGASPDRTFSQVRDGWGGDYDDDYERALLQAERFGGPMPQPED